MLALLLQAIAMASRPDSTVLLTESHLKPPKKRRLQKLSDDKPVKKARHWRGVYENKDTPIHHH